MRGSVFCLFLLLFATQVHAGGVWHQNPNTLATEIANSRYSPKFLLLQAGTFDGLTGFKPRWIYSLFTQACGQDLDVLGWLSYSGKKNTKFTRANGKQLAKALMTFFELSCLKGFELYFENFPYQKQDELADFLEGLRAEIPSERRVLLHVPALAPGRMTSEQLLALLKNVDGLNISLAGTTATDDESYLKLIDAQVDFVQAALAKNPKKRFILGVVAFVSGRTWESSDNFYRYLLHASDAKIDLFCDGSLDIAFFASFLMDDHRRSIAGKIDRWISETCKKRKKK